MPLRIDQLSATDPRAGGKARGLAAIRDAGLPVPDGWLLLPDEPADALATVLDDAVWIVRSSATLEDAADHAAPGIFATVRDVARAGVAAAVAAVRASLRSPAAAAYRQARGLDGEHAAMAVLVQRQVAGHLVTAWSRPPGSERGVLVETEDGGRALVDEDHVAGTIRGLSPSTLTAIAAVARRLEVALGGPTDLELVVAPEGDPWVVQARRIPPAGTRAPVVGTDELDAALAFSRAEPALVWTWDAEHNPAPLSAAQAGLVELVDDAAAATYRQRVVLAYLYTAPGGAAPHRLLPPAELADLGRDLLEAELARMGPDLEETLHAYLAFYRRYSLELRPSLAAAPDLALAAPLVPPVGDLAPRWDVAEPTYGERSRPPAPSAFPSRLRDVDDLFFARAQAGVRRALLLRAATLGLPAEDIFDLPLREVRAGLPVNARARALVARADRARLAAFTPPTQIVGGRALPALPNVSGPIFRGRGTGGQARGRIFKLDEHLEPPPPGRILVAATLIPTMAPLLVGARAVIAEHGGLLGHGAALARELGIPCLVGCVGALGALGDGEELWLDADAGVAVRLGR